MVDNDSLDNLKACTIDEVIQSLDRIIAWSAGKQDRLGYFPALYRRVTIKVREGIKEGMFEDGKRMERLDVIFANRYLEAFEQSRNSGTVTNSWKLAFGATLKWRPVVLQHLLLGMNAHIQLDLGIAAAKTVEGHPIMDLRNDFLKINDILISEINQVEDELGEIWPAMRLLDRLAGKTDETLTGFVLKISRNLSWDFAVRLSGLTEAERGREISDIDNEVAEFGRDILYQGFGLLSVALLVIKLTEIQSVSRIIGILNQ
ncbi:MAG TPA: DUF5995 family protein [Balneolales bacterium]|nr:DUF5995 family protein [Balneolales bacterium]